MRFVLVLLAVALVACQDPCPPVGGTALIPGLDWSRLAPFETYYICRHQAFPASDSDRGDTLEFNVTSGVWRLQDSQVFVDQRIQINVIYPARIDFTNTFFDALSKVQSAENWRGINVFGSPEWSDGFDPSIGEITARRSAPAAPWGDCGNFNNVGFDNVSDDDDVCDCNLAALSLFSCNGRTKVNSIRFFRGYHLLKMVNCTGIVANDVIATHRPDDAAQAGVVLSNSQVAFVRLFINHEDDCLEVRDGSSVTLCYPWFEDGNRTDSMNDPDNKIVIGEGSSVAIAGPNNIYPEQDEILSFESGGGVVYFLKTCPKHFATGYDMHLWTSYVTSLTLGSL